MKSLINPLPLKRLLSVLLLFLISVAALADNPGIMVKMEEGLDSAQGHEGQQYAAIVARDSTIEGVLVPKGTQAVVMLIKGVGNNAWTLTLAAVDLNGKIMLVRGNSPAVVPMGAGDLLNMSKKTISTPTRIAIAAGLTVRFSVSGPLTPAPANVTRVPAGSPQRQPPAQGPAPEHDLSGTAGTQAPPARAAVAPAADAPRAVGGGTPYQTKQGPAVGPEVVIGAGDADFQAYGVTLHLIGCGRDKSASTSCDFTYINHVSDRQVAIGKGVNWGALDGKGQVLADAGLVFAGTSRNGFDTVKDVLTYGRLLYDGADPDVSALKRVPISLGLQGDDTHPPQHASFEWRGVGLAPNRSPAPEPPGPLAKEIDYSGVANLAPLDVNGYRMTIQRCNRLAADPAVPHEVHTVMAECFVRVENQRADRELQLTGAELTDDRGRIVGDSYGREGGHGWVGNKAEYEHMTIVPATEGRLFYKTYKNYNRNPTLAADDPQYFYLIFDTLNPNVVALPEIRVLFSTNGPGGGYGPFTAVFRDIHFSHPPPPHAAAAPAKKIVK